MGEAWFMVEDRRMFTELTGNLDRLPTPLLQEALTEIASGTSAHGPMREWHDWYHYLLAALLPRSHDAWIASLLESLITAFIALYPNGMYREPYRGFLHDALTTLGRCMMDAACWHGRDIAVGKILHRSDNNPNRFWGWRDASGDFSASMFFCLKYLPSAQVDAWLHSMLVIDAPHWRAQVLVWLVGARDILTGAIAWPSQCRDDAVPGIAWKWSHCLDPRLAANDDSGAAALDAMLPQESRTAVLRLVQSYFSANIYLQWLESIYNVPYLQAELGDIPSAFETLYVNSPRR